MEVGTFSIMNAAVSKFVNSCTEATCNACTVFHYKQRGNGHYRCGNRRCYRGRGGYYNDHGDRRQREDDNYDRGRENNHNKNRGNNDRRNDNNRNVRVTQSENRQVPLCTQE